MIVLLIFSGAVVAAFGARIGWQVAISAERLIAALTGWLINRLDPMPTGVSGPGKAPARNSPYPPPKPKSDD